MSKLVDILNNSFHSKLMYTIVFTINIGVYIDVNFKETINVYIIQSLILNINNVISYVFTEFYSEYMTIILTFLHPRNLMSVYVYVYYMHARCSYLVQKEDFGYPTRLLSIWLSRNLVSHWSWRSPFFQLRWWLANSRNKSSRLFPYLSYNIVVTDAHDHTMNYKGWLGIYCQLLMLSEPALSPSEQTSQPFIILIDLKAIISCSWQF